MVSLDVRKVLEVNGLTVILTPSRMLGHFVVLASDNRYVRVVVGSGNLLTSKLLDPRAVVIHYAERCLDNNPITFVAYYAFGHVMFDIHCFA